MNHRANRRTLLLGLAALAGSLAGHGCTRAQNASTAEASLSASSSVSTSTSAPTSTPIPERNLGKTGIQIPIFGLGGAGQTPLSWDDGEQRAIALVEKALELGIRYFDTAASYGPSETYLGKVLPAHRADLFLASKTGARDRDGAWQDLERSLQRLQTDRLDLWQLHSVSYTPDLDTIFGESGAIKAMEEAREQGIVRFVGITGHHDPTVIAAGLKRYPFDTALIPVNAADPHHPQPFIPAVLPVARERGVGVIAMKVPAYGHLLKPGVLEGMHQAMGYSLSQAGVDACIIAAETPEQLEANVQVARAFQPLSATELAAIEQRTAEVWQDNTFFRSWA